MRAHIQHSIVVGPFLINLKSDTMQASLHYYFNSPNENREKTSHSTALIEITMETVISYYLDPFRVYLDPLNESAQLHV